MESQVLTKKAAKSLGNFGGREETTNKERILLCDKSAKVKKNALIWTQTEVVRRLHAPRI